MAFDPVLESGEQVSVHFHYENYIGGRGNKQFGLVLTNRAVYWPGYKFGFGDSIITKRMPLAEVVSVSIRDVWHLGRLLVGCIMFISGAIGLYLVFGVFLAAPAGINGALAMIVVSAPPFMLGPVLAVHGGRRRTLVIASEQTKFTWAEHHVLWGDGPGATMFVQVRDWAQNNGLPLEVELEE